MRCYINRDSEVFKETGEFRAPKIGEYFLYTDTETIGECVIKYLPTEKRIILEEIKR